MYSDEPLMSFMNRLLKPQQREEAWRHEAQGARAKHSKNAKDVDPSPNITSFGIKMESLPSALQQMQVDKYCTTFCALRSSFWTHFGNKRKKTLDTVWVKAIWFKVAPCDLISSLMIPDTNNLVQPIGLSSRHNKSGPACGASCIFEAYCAWRKLASINWQSQSGIVKCCMNFIHE